MAESIQCPGCGKSYPLKEELLGRLVQCQTCGHAFRITPPAKPAPTPAAKPQTPPQAAAKPQAPKAPGAQPSPANPVAKPAAKESLAPLANPLANLLDEELTSGPPVADPRPMRPLPSAISQPFAEDWERPRRRSGGFSDGFLVTHKLLVAVLVASLITLIVYAAVGMPLVGFFSLLPLALLVPFGLLPPPPRGQSIAGKVYLIINLAAMAIMVAIMLLATVTGLGNATPQAAGAIAGLWCAMIVAFCIWGGIAATIAHFMTEYGFFRVAAWLFLFSCMLDVFVRAPLLCMMKNHPERFANQSSETPGGVFRISPTGTATNSTSAADSLLASPRVQEMIQQHGANQVIVVHVTGLPDGLSSHICDKVKQAAGGNPGYSATSTSGQVVMALAPTGDLEGLASRIDFGTVTKVDAQRRIVLVKADLAKLPEPPKPEATSPLDPNFYKQNLADLRGVDQHRRRSAVQRLKRAEPKELREEITQALLEKLTDSDTFIRRDAVEALGVWGGEEIVPPLIDMLASEDRGLCDKIMELLAQRKDPRALEPMIRLLDEFGVSADRHLVTMGSMAEGALLEQIEDLKEDGQAKACEVLGQIGTEKSIPKLTELARREEFRVQHAAEEAVRKINRANRVAGRGASPSPAAGPGGTADQAAESSPFKRMTEPSDSKPEPSDQAAETSPFKRVAEPSAPHPDTPANRRIDDALLELKMSDESRRKAAERLGRMLPDDTRRKEVARALAEALADADETWARQALLEALMVWFTPETIPAMIECAQDDDFGVRRAAIAALSHTKDERAARAIADRLGEDGGQAAEALIAMGPIAEKVAMDYIKHPNREVRNRAIEVLGAVGSKDCVPVLMRLARSPDFFTRVAAERAIQAMRQRRDWERIEKSLPRGDASGLKKIE